VAEPLRSKPLRRLLKQARAHRTRIRLACASSVLGKVFDLAPPFLIGAAVDLVGQRENSLLASLSGVKDAGDQLGILALLTVVIWGFESLFEYAQKILWRNLAQSLQHELRVDAYEHVQGLEMAFFEEGSTGGLMSVLNDDVNQLERFLDGGANDLLEVATTVAVIGPVFFYFAPSVAWLSFMPIPFILWGSWAFQRKIAPHYARVRDSVGLLNGELAGNLGGIATIKSFAAEEKEVDRITRRSEEYRERNRVAIRLSSAFSPLIRMIIVVGFTATMISGGKLALEGSLAVGSYATMVFLTQRLLWPMTRLAQTVDLFQRAMASTNRLLDLLETKPAIVSGGRRLTEPVEGRVTFEDVTFSYPGHPPLFRELDLEFEAGRTTAIVGSTGSGKTTIAKLLLRFYDVGGGAVKLDGIDVRELDLLDLRRAVGFVSQDVFLFHGTVRENIVYGRPGASDREVVEAATVAEADEFIRALPDGYDTIVGERGQKLSGGQRQRISIARAVLKDPPVLLLDEATSAVDNETEAAIQRSLRRVSVGRTTIVIAHRLSTVRHADRTFVLQDGVVAEKGRHEELVRSGGSYASLWRVQTGEAVAPG